MTTQFEQGNQARLDVTREELRMILEALELGVWLGKEEERRKILKKKVREALDRYQ